MQRHHNFKCHQSQFTTRTFVLNDKNVLFEYRKKDRTITTFIIRVFLLLKLFRGCIFSHMRPMYEWAVSDLDP
jgi:hypothetical protein